MPPAHIAYHCYCKPVSGRLLGAHQANKRDEFGDCSHVLFRKYSDFPNIGIGNAKNIVWFNQHGRSHVYGIPGLFQIQPATGPLSRKKLSPTKEFMISMLRYSLVGIVGPMFPLFTFAKPSTHRFGDCS